MLKLRRILGLLQERKLKLRRILGLRLGLRLGLIVAFLRGRRLELRRERRRERRVQSLLLISSATTIKAMPTMPMSFYCPWRSTPARLMISSLRYNMIPFWFLLVIYQFVCFYGDVLWFLLTDCISVVAQE